MFFWNLKDYWELVCIFLIHQSNYSTRKPQSSHFREKFWFSRTLLIPAWKVLILMQKHLIFMEIFSIFTDFVWSFTECTRNYELSLKCELLGYILVANSLHIWVFWTNFVVVLRNLTTAYIFIVFLIYIIWKVIIFPFWKYHLSFL